MKSKKLSVIGLGKGNSKCSCHTHLFSYSRMERNIQAVSTVLEQKQKNNMINQEVSESEYVSLRNSKNKGKPFLIYYCLPSKLTFVVGILEKKKIIQII